jgi:hypothetical protein
MEKNGDFGFGLSKGKGYFMMFTDPAEAPPT